MKIYNSYTSQTELFVPQIPGKISMYVCGPTVYNYIHIGNARPVVFFDVVRNFFQTIGYKVKFASNFTDVDDKIIQRAKDEHSSELEVAQFYIDAFLKDLKSLNVNTDYIQPRVTEYMRHIVDYIQWLIDHGFAYAVDGDVYFRVAKIDEYGHLSNRKLDDLISGARVEINPKKESPLDFTLWKQTNEGINWDSTFAKEKGRPGWHTECVAMIDDIFGGVKIDIHGGGSDLVFPHHENEIAQSIAHHDHIVASYWMHNGRLNLEGEKMSKSIGNVIFVKDLPSDRMGFRMLLLATHYRAPLNYNPESLESYNVEWKKIIKTKQDLHTQLKIAGLSEDQMYIRFSNNLRQSMYDRIHHPEAKTILTAFYDSLEDDFNTPNAISALNSIVKLANQSLRLNVVPSTLCEIYLVLRHILNVLGINQKNLPVSKADVSTYLAWQKARKEKNFADADKYRTILAQKGII